MYFFVRILEAVTGGSRCVVFLSFVLSNGTMVSKKFDRVICIGLKNLRKEVNAFKRVRSKQSNPLKTSSHDEEGNFFVSF